MSFGAVIYTVSGLWLASEILLARFKRAKSSDERQDNSSMRNIWIVIGISVCVGVFFGFQSLGHFRGGSILGKTFGIALIVCGIVIRWIAILTLKSQFTVDVAITKHHQLVTHGIYRYLRHPSYSGSLLSFLGLGLVLANYISILSIVVPVCWAFLRRIRIEEQVLADNFGIEYLDYCSSTKRLIPFMY
jgi:protein-S-isoprenylcysteine O-methyltransferase Ste14